MVLLASLAFWWTTEDPFVKSTLLSPSDIEWAVFPLVPPGDEVKRQKANLKQHHQCNVNIVGHRYESFYASYSTSCCEECGCRGTVTAFENSGDVP